jgi:hypothetical protein
LRSILEEFMIPRLYIPVTALFTLAASLAFALETAGPKKGPATHTGRIVSRAGAVYCWEENPHGDARWIRLKANNARIMNYLRQIAKDYLEADAPPSAHTVELKGTVGDDSEFTVESYHDPSGDLDPDDKKAQSKLEFGKLLRGIGERLFAAKNFADAKSATLVATHLLQEVGNTRFKDEARREYQVAVALLTEISQKIGQ